MSTTLYWRPAPKEIPPEQSLPYDLKRLLGRRIWEHDGSLRGDEVPLSNAWLNYLDGLSDGGVDGASELAEAIREHGIVIVWID